MRDIISRVKRRIEEDNTIHSHRTKIDFNGIEANLVCEPERIIYPFNDKKPYEYTGKWIVYAHKGVFFSFEYLTDVKPFPKYEKAKKYYDKLLKKHGEKKNN